MDKNKQLEKPPHRIENGRKVYTLTHFVNSAPRKAPGATQAVTVSNAAVDTTGAAPGDETGADGDQGQSGRNAHEVREHTRLLSMIATWCWNEYYGPMFVDYSYDNGAAIRQIPDLVNNSPKQVPLMWNHSEDIARKAGRIADASWEESTDIPPGANGYQIVNRLYDPKAALGLELGELDSTSIAVDFDKVRSHPDMDFWTFMDLQGKVVDGVMVAWWPIAAKRVCHHALVTAGADPYSGPREEQEQSMQNAATAAANTRPEGGRGMDELIGLLTAVCNGLGINVALSAGSPIPETLEKRVTDQLTTLRNAQANYNDLAAKLQGLGNSLLKEGETALSAAEVLNRLPERIALAKHGEAFVANQQQTALAWFDKARVDPANKDNLTDVDKRRRERIANSTDLQFLADEIAVCQAEAKARFGPGKNMRSSVGHELPEQPTPGAAGVDHDIAEGVKSLGLEAN